MQPGRLGLKIDLPNMQPGRLGLKIDLPIGRTNQVDLDLR